MRELSRERSKEMSCGSHEEIIYAFSKSRQMQVSRGIETTVEEGIKEMVVDRYRYRGCVEEQSIKCKNRSSIYPPAMRSYQGGKSFLDLSTRYREAVEIAI